MDGWIRMDEWYLIILIIMVWKDGCMDGILIIIIIIWKRTTYLVRDQELSYGWDGLSV